MTTKKKYCAAILFSLVLGVGPLAAPSWSADTADIAADSATPDIDSETPAFNNPAQAQHAANVAQQAAIENTAVQEALQNVESAQDAMDQTLQSNDPAAVDAARDALTAAEKGYMESLSNITGVIEDDIASMRDSGMGWGEISHELGVHPGMLGLGHTNGKQNHFSGDAAEPAMGRVDPEELNEATARNMASGWSMGHGVGVQAGVHNPGTGLSDGRSRGHQVNRESNSHASDGVAGAGGLGHGGGSGNSMGGGSASGNHGPGNSTGGGSMSSSGGPGHSGGSSNAGGHGAAGTDGSPGNSGNAGNSGNTGSQGSSGGHGNSGASGGTGSSSSSGNSGSQGGHGSSGSSGGHGNSGNSEGHGGGGGRW